MLPVSFLVPVFAYFLNYHQIDQATANEVLSANINNSQQAASDLTTINDVRTGQGISPVSIDGGLQSTAEKRANEIVDSRRYQHLRTDGSFYFDLLENKDRWSCENLQLQSSKSLKEATEAWLKSPGHKGCLLSESTTRAGLAVKKFDRLSIDGSMKDIYVFVMILQ